MIAVLTLISGLLAIGIAVVGWFGYSTIRDEAAKRAESAASQTAETIASKVASRIAKDAVKRIVKQEEASGLTTAQAESLGASSRLTSPNLSGKRPRRRAMDDSGLRKEEE